MSRAGPILAIDIGGSGLRAGFVDRDGRIIAIARRSVPIPPAASDGTSEIDPALWWDALGETVAELAEHNAAAFDDIAGIAACGLTRTQVLVDDAGAVVRPALTFNDTRAAGIAADAAARSADPEAARLDGFHPTARLLWLAREEPDAYARIAYVLDPKDFLTFRLTGRAMSDRVSLARLLAAARSDAGDRGGDRGAGSGPDANGKTRSLAADLGIAPLPLPPLGRSADRVGTVRAGLPATLGRLSGVPVFVGTHDTLAAVIGLGALVPGRAYNISGTTEVTGVVGTAPAQAPGLLTVDWGDGLWQLGGPGQNGAALLDWLARLTGRPDLARPPTEAEAASADPDLLFLPFVNGERVPFWDPALRGAFLGLAPNHGPVDLAVAVMRGIACLGRIVIDRAEAATGVRAREVRLGGGSAANPTWARIKADVFQRDAVIGRAAEPGLVGAAAIAFTGLGHFPDLAEAQDHLAVPAGRVCPNPEEAATANRLLARFTSGTGWLKGMAGAG